jgi:hypothetical protein
MSSLNSLAFDVGVIILLAGCSSEVVTVGLSEPIRIPAAQFREGKLPGSPPLTIDEVNAGVEPDSPFVFSLNLSTPVVHSRELGRGFSGLASRGSGAIGVQLAELGSGYWLLPTGGADPESGNAVEWQFRAAFGESLPTGLRPLLLAAFDRDGNAGTQVALTLCFLPEIPDNHNACDPTQDPPHTVVSLAWDTPVDMDLRVVTPDGKLVTPKHPSTARENEDGEVDPTGEGVGNLDFDSFANCSDTGRRRENLVFQTRPAPGNYLVYAGLFDVCNEHGVGYSVSIHNSVAREDGEGREAVETYRQAGQLSAVHADGGSKLGTFVTSFLVK